MSLDSLYPASGDHAIQNAVFAIEFQGVLSSSQLEKLQLAAVKAYGAEFKEVHAQQKMAVDLTPRGGLQEFKAIAQPGGFLMLSGSPLSLPRTISVTPNDCVITFHDYSRWDIVKADVQRYLAPILKLLDAFVVPVNVVGLQYNDVFHWKAEPGELNLTEVFAAGTPFLVPHVLRPPESSPRHWHCHHGYFVNFHTPVSYQQLDNINISRVSASGHDSIVVLTSHKAQLKEPLWQVSKKNKTVIPDIQESLHNSNKTILRELLSESVRSKIKLS